MEWQEEPRLKVLLCDDEIGAQLQFLQLACVLLDDGDADQVLQGIDYDRLNNQWGNIRRVYGKEAGPGRLSKLNDIIEAIPLLTQVASYKNAFCNVSA